MTKKLLGLKNLLTAMYVFFCTRYAAALDTAARLMRKEISLSEVKAMGASHFVEILVAIIIVIALAVVFKEKITDFITAITTAATTKAQALF